MGNREFVADLDGLEWRCAWSLSSLEQNASEDRDQLRGVGAPGREHWDRNIRRLPLKVSSRMDAAAGLGISEGRGIGKGWHLDVGGLWCL